MLQGPDLITVRFKGMFNLDPVLRKYQQTQQKKLGGQEKCWVRFRFVTGKV